MEYIINVLDSLILFWSIIAMLRFLLQKGGLSYTHPLAIFLYKMTHWIVKPMRKLVPPFKGWDLAIPVTVFIVLFFYELFKIVILIFKMQINLKLVNMFSGSFLIILLIGVTAFIYALWFEIIAWYILKNNSKDRQLLNAFDFSLRQLLLMISHQFKPRLLIFIISSFWILFVYPEALYLLQRFSLS